MILTATVNPETSYRKDFLQEYTLARAVAEGVNPYLPTQILADRYLSIPHPLSVFPHPTPHPPPVAILALPLVVFDYSTAAVVWLILEIVLLIAATHTTLAALGCRPGPLGSAALSLILLNWYPFSTDLVLGQLMIAILLLATLTWWSLKRGHRVRAGLFLGLALLVKPVLWPLCVLLLVRREYRTLASTGVVALAGYAAAVAAIGLDTTLMYFSDVLPAVDAAYHGYIWNTSLLTIGWRVFDGTYSTVEVGTTAPPLYPLDGAATMVSAVLLVSMAGISAVYARRVRGLDAPFGVMLCVSILVSPISWQHYQTLAFIPLTFATHRLVALGLPRRETALAVAVAALLFVSSPQWLSVGAWLAGQGTMGALPSELPFVPALLSLMPAVAIIALGFLAASLGTRSIREWPT